MRIMTVVLIVFLVTFTGTQSRASGIEKVEEVEEIEEIRTTSYYRSSDIPRLERAVSILAANPTRKKSFLVIIDHRNREAVDEEPIHDFFGFDAGGVKIGLGLRYGLLDDLDIGFYRLNGTVEAFDVYEFDFRYRFLKQENHLFDLALRPGFTLFSQQDTDNAYGGYFQILASRTLTDRFRLGTGLLYHSDSSNDVKSDRDKDFSAAGQIFFEAWILPKLAWNVEMSANLAGYGASHPQFTSSLKIITHRHTFAILLSNTQYISADGVVSNTERGLDDLLLGFSITRELSF